MSGKVPSLGPGQGSYGQFQLPVSQTPDRQPRDPRQETFAKLDKCIPKDEDQWQESRRRRNFETPEDIYRTVSALVEDRLLPLDLRRLVYIAVCCVEHRKNEAEAYRNYRARVDNQDPGELTIRNYMSLVRGVIALTDDLYLTLRHRAFEAVLLVAPLGLASLGYYRQLPDRFKSCFPRIKIIPEEQASLPLYLPFIVTCRHPEYKYNDVCEALDTSVLDNGEFVKFVSVLESKKPIPHILPAPPGSQLPVSTKRKVYDPIRDEWLDEEVDMAEHFNTEELYAIPDRITGYKVFDIPETIQQKAAIAAKEQDGCVPQEISGVISFRFDWSTHHDVVCSQVLGAIVGFGFLSPGGMHLSRSSVRHDSGPITVHPNWLKIVVPLGVTTELAMVSLHGEGFQDNVVWDSKSGFLLGAGTTLLPSRTIHYISVSISTA
ncbi:hypothetical protein FALBO_11797 [Fusarium albosuccineum]|uniref:Uncharacterized protein n=1 Tax=Fusarium albosuccineum TaxID=1237068 RepID=A0A8H4L594_9HYPO|nr:hypothetical protein FALBO_11797 [Fusarium albosuccineum]